MSLAVSGPVLDLSNALGGFVFCLLNECVKRVSGFRLFLHLTRFDTFGRGFRAGLQRETTRPTMQRCMFGRAETSAIEVGRLCIACAFLSVALRWSPSSGIATERLGASTV